MEWQRKVLDGQVQHGGLDYSLDTVLRIGLRQLISISHLSGVVEVLEAIEAIA